MNSFDIDVVYELYEQNSFDKYADNWSDYVDRIGEYDYIEEFLELIGRVEGLSVLDAGCGEGYLGRKLFGLGAAVTGLDVSQKLITIANDFLGDFHANAFTV